MQVRNVVYCVKTRGWFILSHFNCLGTILAFVAYLYFLPEIKTADTCSEEFASGKSDLEIFSERFTFGYDRAYDAVLNTETNTLLQEQSDQKPLNRLRFAADELKIGEKLFVGILSNARTIDTYAIALNKTIGQVLDKTLYFMPGRGTESQPFMQTVIFTGQHTSTVPFSIMTYLNEFFVNSYDWFYFSTDKTYLRADKLLDLVNNMTFTYDIFLGGVRSDGVCDVSGGLLVSRVRTLNLTLVRYETHLHRFVVVVLSGGHVACRGELTPVSVDIRSARSRTMPAARLATQLH